MVYMLYFVTHTPIATICPNGHECVTAYKDTCPTNAVFSVQVSNWISQNSPGTLYNYYQNLYCYKRVSFSFFVCWVNQIDF